MYRVFRPRSLPDPQHGYALTVTAEFQGLPFPHQTPVPLLIYPLRQNKAVLRARKALFRLRKPAPAAQRILPVPAARTASDRHRHLPFGRLYDIPLLAHLRVFAGLKAHPALRAAMHAPLAFVHPRRAVLRVRELPNFFVLVRRFPHLAFPKRILHRSVRDVFPHDPHAHAAILVPKLLALPLPHICLAVQAGIDAHEHAVLPVLRFGL